MDMSHGASQLAAPALSPVQVAKAALRRLALDKIEPTPENYARAYAAEGGQRATACPRRPGRCCSAWPPRWARCRQRRRVVCALMAGQWNDADELLTQSATKALGRPRTGPTCCSGWPMAWSAAAACGPRRARRTAWRACWPAAAATRGACASACATCWRPGRPRPTSRGSTPSPAGWTNRCRRPRRLPHARRRDAHAAAPAGCRRATGARWCTAWKARCVPRCPRARRVPKSWPELLQQLSQRVAEAGATPELVAACRRSVPARAPHAGAPPAPARRTGQAVRRTDAGPDRAGRGRQLGPRPVRGAATAPDRRPERAQRARRQRPAGQCAQAPGGAARRAQPGPRRAQGTDPGHAHRAGRVQRAHRPLPFQRRPPCRGHCQGRLTGRPGRRGARNAARHHRGAGAGQPDASAAAGRAGPRRRDAAARARARRRVAAPVRRGLHRCA